MRSILNLEVIRKYLTNNRVDTIADNGRRVHEYQPVPYRWTHGATDYHLGDGLLIYSFIQHLRAKNCVCLGSGGGFIPRIMTQARRDLHEQKIFTGDNQSSWGDIGTTYIVDAANGIGGQVDWLEKDSFFRENFSPRIIVDTTENAYYNFFVKEDIKIDYLHIDAGHSYENIKQDFELYTQLLSPNAIVSIHDTDDSFEDNYIVSKDLQDQNQYETFTDGPSKFIKEIGTEWQKLNLFNEGNLRTKPSSTGLTILRHA